MVLQEKYSELYEIVRPMLSSKGQGGAVEMSGKLLAVRAMLQALKDQTDEKVVLVSSYRQTLDMLQNMCRAAGFTSCRLDGWVLSWPTDPG